jgi:hypothetical protein
MTIEEIDIRQKQIENKLFELERELEELRKPKIRKTLTFTLFGIPIKTINI